MNEDAGGQMGAANIRDKERKVTFFARFISFFLQARDVAEASQCLFPS